MFQLGSRSDVTSSPTQIPLCAVVNIEITSSNACRNVRILSIEIIIVFPLMKSGKLVDFIKRKKIGGASGTLTATCSPMMIGQFVDTMFVALTDKE